MESDIQPEGHACFCWAIVGPTKMSAHVCVRIAAAKPIAETGLRLMN